MPEVRHRWLTARADVPFLVVALATGVVLL
jgi:hypothetical protein